MTNTLNKILSESTNLSEEAKEAITGAWEAKVTEIREETRITLREEYAKKYEHDKGVLAEAADKFLTDKIQAELEEFAIDKQHLATERVAYKAKIKEHTEKLEKAIDAVLKAEVTELVEDRAKMTGGFKKLENFILKQLSTEIQELREDRNALVEQKVRLLAEGKAGLDKAKKAFVARAVIVVKESVDRILRMEMTQFKDDIEEARENDFGRRIFEAFVGEYATSQLNEKSEIGALRLEMKTTSEALAEKEKVVEGLQSALNSAKDQVLRTNTLHGLMLPLSKKKRGIMKDLLESVATAKLKKAFTKYLPAVLNENRSETRTSGTRTINESDTFSVETGDRVSYIQDSSKDDFDKELEQMKTLAGLK